MFSKGPRAEYDEELNALARKHHGRPSRSSWDGPPDERRLPLIYWFGWFIAQKTRGSARVDLVRPRFPATEPGSLFRRAVAPTRPEGSFGFGGNAPQTGYRNYGDYNERPRFNLRNFGQGARVKVMRHVDFGTTEGIRGRRRIDDKIPRRGHAELSRLDRDYYGEPSPEAPSFGSAVESVKDALQQNFKPPEKPWFDFGAGLNLELDEGRLTPTLRLKVKDFFSIKILPEPMFKIQKRIRLGPSSLGVRVNYELPLVDAQNLWAPPARLMVRFDNHMGGLRVGPKGADFDESILQLGQNTSVRAALGVDFPNQLPLEEGDKIFSWRARRLGIKTSW